jgi:hypothetical protein
MRRALSVRWPPCAQAQASKFKLKGRGPISTVYSWNAMYSSMYKTAPRQGTAYQDPDRRAISKLVADDPGWLRPVVSVVAFR